MVPPPRLPPPRRAGGPSRTLLKSRPLQQSRLSLSAPSASSSAPRAPRTAPLRQASLFQLPGVAHESHQDDSTSLGVAPTLYLGDADVLHLKATLDASAQRVDALLAVLKRLSTVPCTRAVLESTRIGVSVGHLRRHADGEVSGLAERIVAVWKRQIAEERAQKVATAKQHAGAAASSTGGGGGGMGGARRR